VVVETDAVEALFAKAEVAKATSATAVDAFVRSMRPAESAGASKVAPGSTKQARAVIEEAVYGTARDVLASETIGRLERVWRAVRWVLENTPSAAGLRFEVLDVDADGALAAFEATPREEDFEEPDVFVVADRPSDESSLMALARFAEERMAPCIVS
jgi:predicted component of type VI protein secretion system